MNALRIVDVGRGQARISWQHGTTTDECRDTVPIANPLGDDDRNELRWYLEDYLSFPYGAEREHAARVEERMKEWGEALFRQVFPRLDCDPDPRAFYRDAVPAGLQDCELCICSDDPRVLGIPWEIMRDPESGGRYIAPLLAGLYRQHTAAHAAAVSTPAPGEPFRILYVMARPYGERDIPLGTVARPMLDVLRPLRRKVELDVLRPFTFGALERRLTENRGRYQLVHFDGHGAFVPAQSSGPLSLFGSGQSIGFLAFETAAGKKDSVGAGRIGQALATAGVPLFVLNACQSAQQGGADPFSSVAACLVATGATGVVAMSYSVHADTAAQFMERFYERLVAHEPLSVAVAAGRRSLHATPQRRSVIGDLPLQDWVVPSLYQQTHAYVPIPAATTDPGAPESREDMSVLEKAEKECPPEQFGFIGRDYDILDIERALWRDDKPWVLISGMGGIGKTQLAYAFARWFAETGGCPDGLFVTSFKTMATVGKIIGDIVGYGTDLSRLPEAEQRRLVIDYLRRRRCLLVWDNFETVAGYPNPEDALATDADRGDIADFLRALRGGKSRVIITTRHPKESWLRISCTPVKLSGLVERDAGLLAREILSTVGKRPEDFRDDPDYSRLIGLLNGHPKSLEVVLPHLEHETPARIIDALQYRVDALGEAMEDASLVWAFEHLSDRARRHLPFVGLFTTYVHVGVLCMFARVGDEQERIYREIIGEAVDEDGWKAVLDEAARCGFVDALGSGFYALHPTIPVFLRRRLRDAVGDDGVARLDRELTRFYAGWSGSLLDGARKADAEALTAVHFEEANFLRALRLAEDAKSWAEVQAIIQTLGLFYEARERCSEWRILLGRLLDRLGRRMPPDADRDKADLWMFLLGSEAIEAFPRNALDEAEAAYTAILQYLVESGRTDAEPKIATAYHELGMIYQERGQYDEAEAWYRKALEIRERRGLERDAASDYHQLGNICLLRGQYDAAEEWYRKAVEIRERLGLERDAASDYHQLGIVEQLRGRYDEAERWYRKALEIRDRRGLERDAAENYHQLGMVYQERGQYTEAEEWYRKALEVFERLGLERDAASDYHQLGMVYQERGQYDEAEGWYRKALVICERLGHPPLRVNTLAQLGVLRVRQEHLPEAVSWLGRAYRIAVEHKMLVRSRIAQALAQPYSAMGEKEFVSAWREAFPGEEPPLDEIRKAL